jgi:Skp family chaperone for outer membrane proteins
MKLRTLAFAAVAFLGAGQAALAQTKVFVVNEATVRRESKIGKDMTAKLGNLQNAGAQQLGLDALAAEIRKEDEALKPQIANLTPEAINANPTLKAKNDALNRKKGEFLQKRQVLEANLGEQGGAASEQFTIAMAPAVEFVAKQAGADIVLSGSSVWFHKDTVDLSAKVVQRLDATTPSYDAFVQSMQAQAAAQQPAAGAATPPAR